MAKVASVEGPEGLPEGAEAVKTGNIPEGEAMGGHLTKQLANRHTQVNTLNNSQATILSNNMLITMAKSTTRDKILMDRSTTGMVRRPNIHSRLTQASPASTLYKQTSLNMRLKRSMHKLHIRSRVINQRIRLSRKHRPMSLHPLPIRGKWLSTPLTKKKKSQLSRQSRRITLNKSTSPDNRSTRQRFQITQSKSITERFQNIIISQRLQRINTQIMITNPKLLSMRRKDIKKHHPIQSIRVRVDIRQRRESLNTHLLKHMGINKITMTITQRTMGENTAERLWQIMVGRTLTTTMS